MHYYKDTQERERKVTADLETTHFECVASALGIRGRLYTFTEFDKKNYFAEGDVDLLIYHEPNTEYESLIACEVKTSFLNASGELKSAKPKKSIKQLKNLDEDGFDYVWLLEVIVCEPSDSWFHPLSGRGLEVNTVDLSGLPYGHVKLQITGVAWKPEADAGATSWHQVQVASKLPLKPRREHLMERVREQVAIKYRRA